ncbi:SurA N-terminal domain-containing protein [Goodfellowiella coeruleoviolacea]|uniref:SurA N-terminal domain-containing protein n=1 Tax=Goodfellowiella coeruleoviolacea TaxID=334858 RepID=A0AAE3GJU4_9PSEU|nr:SurA N-terminal domain-containing protein [Goodfellowiella coeruleoviolacea]MCP2168765.1 SurA N-terminal domain-containing protein [Goodfellowiella coeruleoviolacea]
MTRRRGALGALGVTAALLLAGCGSGPSQPGAAAIVGDVAIPLELVQQRLDNYLAREPEQGQQLQQQNKLGQVAEQILSYRVRHELVAVAAQRDGVKVDEQQLNELIAAGGGAEAMIQSQNSFLDAQAFRDEQATDQLLLTELGRRYADRLTVTYDYTIANGPEEAKAKADRIAADPEHAADVFEADRRQNVPSATDVTMTAAQDQQFLGSPIYGVRAGSVVAFQAGQDSGAWVVAHVRSREITAGTGASGDQLNSNVLYWLGLRAVQPIADELGVRVNPRYGVWDEVFLQTAPSKDEKYGYLTRVREKSGA